MNYGYVDVTLASEKYILVDSDVLIDVLRLVPLAAAVVQDVKRSAPLATSIVSRMEIITGSVNREALQSTERLLSKLEIIPISEEISRVADDLLTRYYLSHRLLIPDALIAATALVHDTPLLSKNQRDYRFIPNLKLLPYPAGA